MQYFTTFAIYYSVLYLVIEKEGIKYERSTN